jgi:hypothetical protein
MVVAVNPINLIPMGAFWAFLLLRRDRKEVPVVSMAHYSWEDRKMVLK